MPKVYVLPNGEEYTFPDDKGQEGEKNTLQCNLG